MFGPDICGSSNRRTHVIFNYPAKDENLEAKSEIKCETDQKSHLYTLHIKADASYEVCTKLYVVRRLAITHRDRAAFIKHERAVKPRYARMRAEARGRVQNDGARRRLPSTHSLYPLPILSLMLLTPDVD